MFVVTAVEAGVDEAVAEEDFDFEAAVVGELVESLVEDAGGEAEEDGGVVEGVVLEAPPEEALCGWLEPPGVVGVATALYVSSVFADFRN